MWYPNHVRHSKIRFQVTYTVYSMLPSSDTFVPFEILLHAIVIAVLVGPEQPMHWVSREVM
jgi:hypothetical protein